MRYFEDLKIGEGGEFGPLTVTEADIIEFAQRYDPQPFHTDPAVARDSIYGGLIASGLHSAVIATRLTIDGWLHDIANLGSPGLEATHLRQPLRPGDTVWARAEVLELRPSKTRPDRGIVRYSNKLVNQSGTVLLDTVAVIFVRRREPATVEQEAQ